jgi:hypothetical protein
MNLFRDFPLKNRNSYKAIIIGSVNAICFVFMARTAAVKESK